MRLEDRGMQRREFRRITSAKLSWKHVTLSGFSGFAGMLDIEETDGAWLIPSVSGRICIAAPGYRWLQLSPSEGGWWLTVMYDTGGELVQYYFDIIARNYLSENGEPRFIDMFLDVVMSSDGQWRLLDASELDAALECGLIDPSAHREAHEQAQSLIGMIDGKEEYWRDLCAHVIKEIGKN